MVQSISGARVNEVFLGMNTLTPNINAPAMAIQMEKYMGFAVFIEVSFLAIDSSPISAFSMIAVVIITIIEIFNCICHASNQPLFVYSLHGPLV